MKKKKKLNETYLIDPKEKDKNTEKLKNFKNFFLKIWYTKRQTCQ